MPFDEPLVLLVPLLLLHTTSQCKETLSQPIVVIVPRDNNSVTTMHSSVVNSIQDYQLEALHSHTLEHSLELIGRWNVAPI
jgi:hypothetical protein